MWLVTTPDFLTHSNPSTNAQIAHPLPVAALFEGEGSAVTFQSAESPLNLLCAQAPQVTVKDTVGAGDSFMAASWSA